MSTSYELLYFPMRGRGEAIRLLFAAAKVEFTNTGVTNWPEFKPKTPFGQMPVLIERDEHGERHIAQSMAIARHLARVFDLYGKDETQRTMADMVAETAQDWRGKFAPVWFKAFMHTPEDVCAKYWAALPATLHTFEGLLGKSTAPEAGFFVGESPTFADMLVFDTLDGHLGLDAKCLAEFPKLSAFYERVKGLEHIKAYLEKRT
jgi:glutathione S-transferase